MLCVSEPCEESGAEVMGAPHSMCITHKNVINEVLPRLHSGELSDPRRVTRVRGEPRGLLFQVAWPSRPSRH